MSKKLSHLVEVENDKGEKSKLIIYKDGKSIYINNDRDYEHLIHPSRTDIHQ